MKRHDNSPDDPPSYDESIRHYEKASSSHTGSGFSADIVYSLLTNHILPTLQTAISSETASMTVVLIPSNVKSLQPHKQSDSKQASTEFPGEQLVGFPATDELKLVRLSGQQDTIEFWQKPSSRQSLSDSLHAHLVQEGCFFSEDVARAESSRTPAGWMTVDGEQLQHREANIRVLFQEVCLRLEDEMGLYETRRGKALVVKVRIGQEDTSLE